MSTVATAKKPNKYHRRVQWGAISAAHEALKQVYSVQTSSYYWSGPYFFWLVQSLVSYVCHDITVCIS